MSNYTICPMNSGFIGGGGGKLEAANFYDYHFSLYKIMEKRPFPPKKKGGCVFFLLEGEGRKILVDTGMWDADRANKYHHEGSTQPEGFKCFERLKALGIEPEEIDYVLYTHLHWDHVGYADKFTKAVHVTHRKELAFAKDPIPLYYKSYEHPACGISNLDFYLNQKFETLEGETEILPGIRSFDTPGHSPGHIAFEVDTVNGPYILAGDAAFGLFSFTPVPELNYDITPPGRFTDIIEEWQTLRTLKERAQSLDRILLTHEGSLLDLMEKEPVLGLPRQ